MSDIGNKFASLRTLSVRSLVAGLLRSMDTFQGEIRNRGRLTLRDDEDWPMFNLLYNFRLTRTDIFRKINH